MVSGGCFIDAIISRDLRPDRAIFSGAEMKETPEDIIQLQAILDQSIEKAGSFLRSSMEMPEHSLSATQLVNYLQGNQTVAFATVTAKGEPRIAPIGSFFYRGHFYIPTVA